jgi:hypothetical protein
MSMFSMERALWELTNNPDNVAQFRTEPDKLLASYQLDEEETDFLKAFNVRAMADRDVSPMLLMLAWFAVQGQDTLPEYLGRMNTPPAP